MRVKFQAILFKIRESKTVLFEVSESRCIPLSISLPVEVKYEWLNICMIWSKLRCESLETFIGDLMAPKRSVCLGIKLKKKVSCLQDPKNQTQTSHNLIIEHKKLSFHKRVYLDIRLNDSEWWMWLVKKLVESATPKHGETDFR